MNKKTFQIIGFIIQIISLAVMLYGLINNRTILWLALPGVFIGLFIVLLGVDKKKLK